MVTSKTTTKRKRPVKVRPIEVEPEPIYIEPEKSTLQTWLPWLLVAGFLLFMFKDKLPFINNNPTPAPPVVVNPVNPVTPTVGTITLTKLPALTTKLAGNPVKAKALADLFRDWATTLASTSNAGITTKQLLRAANTSLITMYAKAKNVPMEPQVGAEIDACLIEALGDTPGPVDIARAQAAFNTMALALDQVR